MNMVHPDRLSWQNGPFDRLLFLKFKGLITPTSFKFIAKKIIFIPDRSIYIVGNGVAK